MHVVKLFTPTGPQLRVLDGSTPARVVVPELRALLERPLVAKIDVTVGAANPAAAWREQGGALVPVSANGTELKSLEYSQANIVYEPKQASHCEPGVVGTRSAAFDLFLIGTGTLEDAPAQQDVIVRVEIEGAPLWVRGQVISDGEVIHVAGRPWSAQTRAVSIIDLDRVPRQHVPGSMPGLPDLLIMPTGVSYMLDHNGRRVLLPMFCGPMTTLGEELIGQVQGDKRPILLERRAATSPGTPSAWELLPGIA